MDAYNNLLEQLTNSYKNQRDALSMQADVYKQNATLTNEQADATYADSNRTAFNQYARATNKYGTLEDSLQSAGLANSGYADYLRATQNASLQSSLAQNFATNQSAKAQTDIELLAKVNNITAQGVESEINEALATMTFELQNESYTKQLDLYTAATKALANGGSGGSYSRISSGLPSLSSGGNSR